jgi:hypothetical protein
MRKRPPRRRKACMKRELRPLAAEKNEFKRRVPSGKK